MKILTILALSTLPLLAQQPPPTPPATNTLTYSIYQICFNETSNFLASATVTNVSTNGIPWSIGDYVPNHLAWACCYFCPDQDFHLFYSWTWGPRTTFSTNFVSHVDSNTFLPYYIPASGPVTEELQVWPPTNKDPNALLIYSELLNTNKWHFWGDGKFYGNTVNAGEYLSPAFWRTTNSTNDPFVKYQMRWNGQLIRAWSNNPHW